MFWQYTIESEWYSSITVIQKNGYRTICDILQTKRCKCTRVIICQFLKIIVNQEVSVCNARVVFWQTVNEKHKYKWFTYYILVVTNPKTAIRVWFFGTDMFFVYLKNNQTAMGVCITRYSKQFPHLSRRYRPSNDERTTLWRNKTFFFFVDCGRESNSDQTTKWYHFMCTE